MTYEEAELKLDYILKRYYKFVKLWSLDSERLAKYVLWDYEIDLELGIILKFFLIYKLTEIENLALREFVKENLKKGYIWLLQLLVKYLVLFILKKNGKLRMCINYRQLNSIMKKDWYLLLLILKI